MKYVRPVVGVVLATWFVFTATSHAFGSAPYSRDAKLQRCMVYLPAVKDAKLRRWCMKQQERMP